MADLKIGKGVFIWRPTSIENGDPEKILARLQMAGVQSVALKLADGINVLDDNLERLIPVLRKGNIRVAGWGYSYLNADPKREAQAAAQACERYQPDFYLIDVEAEAEQNYTGAHIFVDELKADLSGMTLGLCSFWNVDAHPLFPWQEFLRAVDFVCPQLYWRGVDPLGKLKRSQESYAHVPKVETPAPMSLVAGDMYIHLGVKSTPEQVTDFLSAVDADPTIQGVFMWAADDSETEPELWQAFSKYQWQDGGLPVPEQPRGWAKIKPPDGLYVRAAPWGSKRGALFKDQLTPIWAINEKWGAITPQKDRWIYIANPNYLNLIIDTSNDPPPPPGLYQARVVPPDGLNVRDKPWGQVIRALIIGTVVHVYEEKDGWARIDPEKSEWVSAKYLIKLN